MNYKLYIIILLPLHRHIHSVPPSPVGVLEQIWAYLSRNSLLRNFNLRVHKFTFQWDLVLHLFICISSLTPFLFTGRRIYSSIPIGVWLFYNVLFLIGPKHADVVVPGFGKLKHSFKSSIEDFFSPKLLPVLSVSFLLVALSLSVTGHRLGGPPLCYRKCGQCLSIWEQSVSVSSVHELMQVAESEQERQSLQYDSFRVGCGYVNGKELLAYYTMAQTSFLLFLTTMIAMAVCLAWRVAEDEREEHSEAEQWLQRQDLKVSYPLDMILYVCSYNSTNTTLVLGGYASQPARGRVRSTCVCHPPRGRVG